LTGAAAAGSRRGSRGCWAGFGLVGGYASLARGAGLWFVVVVGRLRWSAGGWECIESPIGGAELAGPGPGALDVQLRLACGERESGGEVEQPVAQSFGLSVGELALEHQRLGPDDQVVREPHDLQPHLIERELLERELGPVSLSSRIRSSTRARSAVPTLDHRDVLVGLVGEDRLEAVAVVVGERELRAVVRALAGDDQPRSLRPGGQIDAVGDLYDVPVLALASVLVEHRNPGILEGFEDRRADRVGEVECDNETGRRAANAILAQTPVGRSAGPRLRAIATGGVPTLRVLNDQRYRQGQPNLVDADMTINQLKASSPTGKLVGIPIQ
jgi:hypothetical protein